MDKNLVIPLVSIIMPAYNTEKYIQASIDSVLNQTFTNWELIIINDGSTDSTVEIVKENQKRDHRIILINQVNKKQAAARNAGFKISKGEWIAILDSDDLWVNNKLEIQLESCEKADVIYSSGIFYYEVSGIKEYCKVITGFYSGVEMYKKLYISNRLPNLSVLFKRKLIDKSGYQIESNFLLSEDWEYWIRLARNGATFFGIDNSLFLYRIHDNGSSTNRLRMFMGEFCALYDNIDLSIISKEFVYQRLEKHIAPNIDYLLQSNNNKLASEVIRKLLKIKIKVNYFLIYLFIQNNWKFIFNYINYLVYPRKIFSNLKKIMPNI